MTMSFVRRLTAPPERVPGPIETIEPATHGRLNAVPVKHTDQKLLWRGGVHVDQLRAHRAGLKFIDQHETRARAVVLVLDRSVLQG